MSQQHEREIEILWLFGYPACSASSMPSAPAILYEVVQRQHSEVQMHHVELPTYRCSVNATLGVHRTSTQQSAVS